MEFKDNDILIDGTSYSDGDIGFQCWKYGAKRHIISHRTAAMGFDWPKNWAELPLVTQVDWSNANFKNRISREVDAIIFCMG